MGDAKVLKLVWSSVNKGRDVSVDEVPTDVCKMNKSIQMQSNPERMDKKRSESNVGHKKYYQVDTVVQL